MLCFVGGVGLRSFVLVEQFWVFTALGALAVFALSFSSQRQVLVVSAMMCAALFGVWRFSASELHTLSLTAQAGGQVALNGRVAEDPTVKNDVQRLVVAPETAVGERVLVFVKRYPEFAYNDAVRVIGTLNQPENVDGFNYTQYLAKDAIYFTMPFAEVELVTAGDGFIRGLFSVKRTFEKNINTVLAFPHAPYVNGILLGNDGDIPKDLKEAFVITGTSHVLALSGYNITILIAFVVLMLSMFGASRLVAVWVSVTFVFLFVLATGASPSTVRAGVMGVALLLAQQFGRQGRVLNVLVFAAFIMISFNPKILVFDIGFQLSFLAVLGLAYIYPFLWEKFQRIPERFKLKESLITTVSAQVAVLPLLLYNFHSVSLVAPIVNMLILPIIPFAMLFGFLVGMVGFVSHGLASVFAWPLWVLVEFQLSVVKYVAGFSYAVFSF